MFQNLKYDDKHFCFFFFFWSERIKGGTSDYNSDIWSLGMVVVECVIRHFPYMHYEDHKSGQRFFELLEAIVESPPPSTPLNQLFPQICSFIFVYFIPTLTSVPH